MKIDSNKTLYPTKKDVSSIAGITDKTIEKIQSQINDINARVTKNATDIENASTQINTKNINASNDISGISGIFSSVNSNNGSIITLNTQNINNSQKVKSNTVEANSITSTDATVTNNMVAKNINANKVTSQQLVVDNFNFENANINNVNSKNIIATTQISSPSISGSNIQSTELHIDNEYAKNIEVSDDILVKGNANVEKDLTAANINTPKGAISQLDVNTQKAVSIAHNEDTSTFLTISEDVYVKIPVSQATNIKLKIVSDDNNVSTILDVLINVIENGKLSGKITYANNNSILSIFVDSERNIWIKLIPSLTGKIYYFSTGLQAVIPETHAQDNDPFNLSTAKEYNVETQSTGIILYDDTSVIIDTPEIEAKNNVTIDGNLYIKGKTTISGLSSERSKYLGNSNDVTADDNGVFTSKGADIKDDVTIEGDLTVTDEVNAKKFIGDLQGNIIGQYDITVGTISDFILALQNDNITTIGIISGKYDFDFSLLDSTLTIDNEKKIYAIGDVTLNYKRTITNHYYNIIGNKLYFFNFTIYNNTSNNVFIRKASYVNCFLYTAGESDYVYNSPSYYSCIIILKSQNYITTVNLQNLYNCQVIQDTEINNEYTNCIFKNMKNCTISITKKYSNKARLVFYSCENCTMDIQNFFTFFSDVKNCNIRLTSVPRYTETSNLISSIEVEMFYNNTVYADGNVTKKTTSSFLGINKMVKNNKLELRIDFQDGGSNILNSYINFGINTSKNYNNIQFNDNYVYLTGTAISSSNSILQYFSLLSVGNEFTGQAILQSGVSNNFFLLETCNRKLFSAFDRAKMLNVKNNTFINYATTDESVFFENVYADNTGNNRAGNTAIGGYNVLSTY